MILKTKFVQAYEIAEFSKRFKAECGTATHSILGKSQNKAFISKKISRTF